MSSKKRIVIHTGPGKTGSSALQAWFSGHSSELKGRGVFYPKHKIEKNNISSGHIHHVLTEVSGKWQVDPKKIDKLLSDFKRSDCHTLIISSEFFFHNIRELNKCIPNAEFVAYIRNPLELLESNYNQGVKRHSKIHPFHPPNNLDNYFWAYLTDVSKNLPAERLVLRPYEESLYKGGGIVSDLLAVLGIDLPVSNNKINSSYSFSVLEYKRLVNHFGLKDLERELDHALQDCNIGETRFSLMTSQAFQKLTQQNISQMKIFIEEFNRRELLPLLSLFEQASQKPEVQQNQATFKQLKEVNDYLVREHSALHQKLTDLVANNRNLLVDNLLIFKVFEVQHETLNIKEEVDRDLIVTAKGFPIVPQNKGKVLHHLATHYEQVGNFDESLKYSIAAIHFNPGHYGFRKYLNRLLIIKNEAMRKAIPAEIPKPNPLTNLKKKLARTWNR